MPRHRSWPTALAIALASAGEAKPAYLMRADGLSPRLVRADIRADSAKALWSRAVPSAAAAPPMPRTGSVSSRVGSVRPRHGTLSYLPQCCAEQHGTLSYHSAVPSGMDTYVSTHSARTLVIAAIAQCPGRRRTPMGGAGWGYGVGLRFRREGGRGVGYRQ